MNCCSKYLVNICDCLYLNTVIFQDSAKGGAGIAKLNLSTLLIDIIYFVIIIVISNSSEFNEMPMPVARATKIP